MSTMPSGHPIPAIPVLGYAGPTVPQRPAFNARRALGWSGEHLFRVYLTPDSLAFIRIGGAKNNQAAYQFGLLGALIAMWVRKSAVKKEKKKILANEERPLEELLPEHKRNHVVPLTDISDPAVEIGGFWSGRVVRWSFNQVGQKKRISCQFDTPEDVTDALQHLPAVFPSLRVGVQYNEAKNRYDKIK